MVRPITPSMRWERSRSLARLIAPGWPWPKPLPTTYYVKCVSCARVEGQYVESDNQLTVGTGDWADNYEGRGWVFENGEWTCPGC